jgi:hypothetical protein
MLQGLRGYNDAGTSGKRGRTSKTGHTGPFLLWRLIITLEQKGLF